MCIRDSIETAGKAVALRIEAETPTDWKADGMDLQYINAVSYTHLDVYKRQEIHMASTKMMQQRTIK